MCENKAKTVFHMFFLIYFELEIDYNLALYVLYPIVLLCINVCMNIPILDLVIGATRISRIETQTKASSFKNAFKKDAVRIIPKL